MIGRKTCALLIAVFATTLLAAGEGDLLSSQKLGWKLGVQSYSFNRFTLFEAIDKSQSLGLRYMEIYPGQAVAKDLPGVKVGPDLPLSVLARIKTKLGKAGISLTAYGVTGIPNNEAEARKVFDFAKVMGIEVINSEPSFDTFPLIDRLCAEYDLKVGIHNHPTPSRYWDPKTVLDNIKNCSERVGACADTGHWLRSGLDPVECLQKLSGRIVSMHLKDLQKKAGQGAHDVPWGSGVANMDAILAEMKRQGFKGPVSAEYEHNWLNSVPELAQCVAYFEKASKKILLGR